MSEPPRPGLAGEVPTWDRAALSQRAQELAESNIELAKTVRGLTERVSFRTRVFIAVLVLDFLLTIAIAYFGIGYVQTQQQIAALVAKLDRSVHSQCGTLELLIKSYRGAPPPGSPINPRDYRDSYVRIQQQADEVPCNIKHVVPGT